MAIRRGRPRIADQAALRRVAEYIVENEAKGTRCSVRAAILRTSDRVTGNSPDAMLWRLQRKWRRYGPALLADAMERRARQQDCASAPMLGGPLRSFGHEFREQLGSVAQFQNEFREQLRSVAQFQEELRRMAQPPDELEQMALRRMAQLQDELRRMAQLPDELRRMAQLQDELRRMAQLPNELRRALGGW